MEYGEPIEHNFVSKAIENAQGKVEAHNFEIRKNMLEYDDVMNIQRKTIYALRDEVVNSEELKEKFLEMTEDVIELMIDRYCPPRTPVDDWELDALEANIKKVFGLDMEVDEQKLIYAPDPGDEAFNMIWDEVEKLQKEREELAGEAGMRQLEGEVYLYEIDEHWKAHLTAIDHLREGIGLQGYRQVDPKLVYKKQAYAMFEDLLVKIKSAVLERIYHIEFVELDDYDDIFNRRENQQEMHLHHGNQEEDELSAEAATPVTIRREKPKLGRNQPCWCGSGKKYKKCHYQQDLAELQSSGSPSQVRD